MAAKQFLLVTLAVLSVSAAPQFGGSSEEVIPYEFGYGVSDIETGDAKEHKETVSPSGRTEGEYRWLQPNGLFMVVRYYVEGDSGFVAEVSEEPGPDVANYYTNTLTGENSEGVPLPAASFSVAKSIDTAPVANAINPVRNTFRSQPQQNIVSQPRPSSQQRIGSQQRFGSQQNAGVSLQSVSGQQSFGSSQQQQGFGRQEETFGNIVNGGFIDGGIIDGGIIDGGIIDGGIIDGGIINDSFEDDSRRFG